MDYPQNARQAEFIALADSLAGPIAARAADTDRNGTFPFENFAEMRAAGFLGLTVPVEYGRLGANPLEYALAIERIGRACGSTGLAVNMHLSLIGKIAETKVWPEALLSQVARDIAENGALINSVHSEPDLGSPSRGALPGTTARKTPEGYVVNGHKRWASLAPALDYMIILAKILDDEEPRRGNFLLPAKSPGVVVDPVWDNVAMRGTASDDIRLTEVLIPLDSQVRVDGSTVPGDWWVNTPDGGGAVFLGIAQAAFDEAVRFAQTRTPNGMDQPIATLPTIQARIANMQLDLMQARTLLYATADWWVNTPDERAAQAWRLAAAKTAVNRAAIRVTDEAIRVSGSAGLAMTSPLQRYFRDVRASIGQPPIEDIALSIIGKAALGVK
ncbi:MAG: acyl-CoA/acyl-ACP dehydrogenase [Thermomicrobiales bacterium]|nr:acyl-CoA/acyl-ACP dehydrogenase [Thermomicrobiales bacterium]